MQLLLLQVDCDLHPKSHTVASPRKSYRTYVAENSKENNVLVTKFPDKGLEERQRQK